MRAFKGGIPRRSSSRYPKLKPLGITQTSRYPSKIGIFLILIQGWYCLMSYQIGNILGIKADTKKRPTLENTWPTWWSVWLLNRHQKTVHMNIKQSCSDQEEANPNSEMLCESWPPAIFYNWKCSNLLMGWPAPSSFIFGEKEDSEDSPGLYFMNY
jgi:hypothetical protein